MRWMLNGSLKKRLWVTFGKIALTNLVLGFLLVFLKDFIINSLFFFAITLALVLVINFFLIALFTRSIMTPIQHFETHMQQLACDEEIPCEIQPSDPLELQNIKQSLNALLERTKSRLGESRLFVANASHELRTPLTTIKLRVEALRDGAIHDEAVSEKFLNEIENEINDLSKLVTDLLDLSRIESGMMVEAQSEVDLSSIIQDICAAFSMRAQQVGIQLDCTIEADLPKMIGAEEQLRRLLYNLVDNAIKYNRPGGRVAVDLHREPTSHHLQLIVADNGFGIPPSYLPHIFERFYRAEATRPRYGISRGSGLGLAIVKAIADSHGAEINVESESGRGTKIIVNFPLSSCL
ncbi:MAG: sensor histidine kinase [Anaerolineales bacterium]